MPIRQFEPSRAVEVIAISYGSGYRIGGGLVLRGGKVDLVEDWPVGVEREIGFSGWLRKVPPL